MNAYFCKTSSMMYIIFLALSFVVVGTNGITKCNFPPGLWCSSLEIARDCEVLNQCMAHTWSRSSDAKPVEFALYYETLCPDCIKFFSNQLNPTYAKLLESGIFNLSLIPYGNAQEERVDGKWQFRCQHGLEECYGNLIETCSIYLGKSVKKYFHFIQCIESSGEIPRKSAKRCANLNKMDYNAIMMCANGTLGNELEHQMATKTDQLNPPHTFVPWVTLNGVHTDEIQQQAQGNLLKLICDTYQGLRPDVCKPLKPTCIRD